MVLFNIFDSIQHDDDDDVDHVDDDTHVRDRQPTTTSYRVNLRNPPPYPCAMVRPQPMDSSSSSSSSSSNSNCKAMSYNLVWLVDTEAMGDIGNIYH
jgi:hypothetical protein